MTLQNTLTDLNGMITHLLIVNLILIFKIEYDFLNV